MVKDERITIKNRLISNITFKALFSEARINIADRYCARAIIGIL